MNAERVVAGFFAALCLVFLVRLLVGERRRFHMDRAFWRAVDVCKAPLVDIQKWLKRRKAAKQAKLQARELIARARNTSVERTGNVYSPNAFKDKHQRGQASDETQGPGPH